MKQVFHKIMAVTMTFVVLFSTMSFTVNMHYCGDSLVETAFFHKANGCSMEMGNGLNDNCNIVNIKCCNDKQIVHHRQDELQINLDNFSFEQQFFITSYIFTFINLFEGLDAQIVPFKDYKSPLVVKDIQKLDETYLI